MVIIIFFFFNMFKRNLFSVRLHVERFSIKYVLRIYTINNVQYNI